MPDDRGEGPDGPVRPGAALRCSVLGPLAVVGADGVDLTPTGALQRRLLAVLLLNRGRVVPVDSLAEALWPDRLPNDHAAGLHTHVFRLRRRIPGAAIDQQPPGYRLRGDGIVVDIDRFEAAVASGIGRRVDDPQAALDDLETGLGMWRGGPFEDLLEVDDARIESQRLHEVRLRAEEERLEVLLDLGRAVAAVSDAEALVAREPLRERPRELLMRMLATTGRRADALRTFDDFRRRLADELGIDPSGHLRSINDRLLTGVDETPPAVTHRSATATTGRSPIAERCPSPRLVRPLVGRDRVVAAVDDAIGRSRVVTLLGTGGVGKTSLAADAAERLASAFPGGICFLELAGSTPGSVDADVLTAVGAEPRAGVPTGRRIAGLAGERPTLFVLDNCEHVLDEVAAIVEELVAHGAHVTVLTTSRERLAVAGETLVPVPPLRWRDEDRDGDEGLPPALALFVERARDIGVEPASDPSTLGVIAEICRHLDGVPLAIELAATRLRSLGLVEIRDGLGHSHRLLNGGRRAIARHRSMAAALTWSFELLDDRQRELMRALSVFASPFTVRDAAAVADAPEREVSELLAELVERSLVQCSDGSFALLEPVRQFVREEHVDPATRSELARRHARHITAIAEENARLIRTEHAADAFARSRSLIPDLRAAFRAAMDDHDLDRAARLCTAVRDLALHFPLPDPSTWAIEVAGVAARSDHPSAPSMYGIGALGAWKSGDLSTAGELLDHALRTAERLGVEVPFFAVDMLGTLAGVSGRVDEAIEWFHIALATPQGSGDPVCRSETWSTLLSVKSYRHDPDVVEAAERLVGDLLPEGCPVGQAWCWYGAGEAVLATDPELARHRLAQAVEVASASGATFVEAVAAASLASLEVRSGDPTRAAAQYRWLLPLMQRGEAVSPLWTVLRSVTELLVRCGVDEPAATLFGAVSAPGHGHPVFGDDADRLDGMRVTLIGRLGVDRFDRAASAGAALDDAAATVLATAALDEHLPG